MAKYRTEYAVVRMGTNNGRALVKAGKSMRLEDFDQEEIVSRHKTFRAAGAAAVKAEGACRVHPVKVYPGVAFK